MLALTINAIMDFAGERSGHFRMIGCEVQSHEAYGTPPELFGKFFGVIAETMRELLGAEWSPEIDAAWQRLLPELDRSRPSLRQETHYSEIRRHRSREQELFTLVGLCP